MRILFVTGVAMSIVGVANAQSANDADYMKQVMTAAPPQIVNEATIIRMQDKDMQTLKKGSNEWTCMVANKVPMCADPNAMAWAHASQTRAHATDKTEFIYMLAGATG